MSGTATRIVSAALFALVLALAGCAKPAPAGALGANELPSSSGMLATGAVAGFVVDDESVPVEGARLSLTSREDLSKAVAERTSDDAGTFRMDGLADGLYLLHAVRVGYESVSPKNVEVKDGGTARLQIILKPTPIPEPAHYTKSVKRTTPENSVWIGPPYDMTGFCAPCSTVAPIKYPTNESRLGEVAAFIAEMKWSTTQSLCESPIRTEAYSPEQAESKRSAYADDNPFRWDNQASIRNPSHLLIPRQGADAVAMWSAKRTEWNGGTPIVTDGEWVFKESPTTLRPDYAGNGITCYVAHTSELWLTAFHLAPPPSSDWSIFRQ